MDEVEGARSFLVAGSSYDSFMGRYSVPLASEFLDVLPVAPGAAALDLGCGPGALTGALVARLGAADVSACDPSPPFVAECARRHPGVDVRAGRAESIPFDAGRFDLVLAQLVLQFVSDPDVAAAEMVRVARPGGVVAACVWEFGQGMEMLRRFWDAALALDPEAPDEARVRRFGRRGESVALFEAAGLVDVAESTLRVQASYAGFDELWSGFTAGIGPSGAYCAALPPDGQRRLRDRLFEDLGAPAGSFELEARAIAAHGRTPGS